MKKYFIMILAILLFLSACTTNRNDDKGKIDIMGIITRIDESENRILVEDENIGLTWVTLPDHGKIESYEEGQEVAVWIAGGIDTSLPTTAKALNIEFLK